jgi:RNA polymerase sigma-70 factor (ECF subfamily)
MAQFATTLKMWVYEPALAPPPVAPRPRVVREVPLAFGDERLLEALRAKRPGAWLQFYDAFAPYVLSVLRRVLGPDHELEDLVQEVFSRALQGVGRVREADKLKPWLRSLTVFTARETLRRRKWRAWLPLGGDEEEEDSVPMPTTSDALDERLLLRRVQAVLGALSVDDRLAFTLRHFEQLELTEVAETMHISLSTAKRRIARAEVEFRRRASADPELKARLGAEVQS